MYRTPNYLFFAKLSNDEQGVAAEGSAAVQPLHLAAALPVPHSAPGRGALSTLEPRGVYQYCTVPTYLRR